MSPKVTLRTRGKEGEVADITIYDVEAIFFDMQKVHEDITPKSVRKVPEKTRYIPRVEYESIFTHTIFSLQSMYGEEVISITASDGGKEGQELQPTDAANNLYQGRLTPVDVARVMFRSRSLSGLGDYPEFKEQLSLDVLTIVNDLFPEEGKIDIDVLIKSGFKL